jgi:CDP-glucose 4,6-dehydratase
MAFQNIYNGKSVLITGHTGFKGAWLTEWLKILGAKITGISLGETTHPSHFNSAEIGRNITNHYVDVRDQQAIKDIITSSNPDFLFHLAAQSLVKESYQDPVATYSTNVIGTLNILESLRIINNQCVAVLVTSDKCYDNVEWVWGYRETDALGGPDPYSASKGAAELIIRSHVKSYFPNNDSKVRIASARAGNVIGGGDWARDRIIPDCVRAWSKDEAVQLRYPNSTRPWQHVLEPLSGYLNLAVALSTNPEIHGEPFNFGPQAQQNHSVLELVEEMSRHWDKVSWKIKEQINSGHHESGLLKLNCDKALHYLQWHAVMGFMDTVAMTAEWFRDYYQNPGSIAETTKAQINRYMAIAREQGLPWAN